VTDNLCVDVLIVGAGPAGLSAALLLGRSRRSVALFGCGDRRNAASDAMHGFLSHDGITPASFIAAGIKDVGKYPTVRIINDEVIDVARIGKAFTFRGRDISGQALKVLLATGLGDHLPVIPGLPELYGQSVHHCFYCDGYEYADRPIAVVGAANKVLAMALMASHWSRDVIVCANGAPAADSDRYEELRHRGIKVITTPIAKLRGSHGKLSAIEFTDGNIEPREAVFFTTGCSQRSDLWASLGCARDEKGGVITDPLTEETTAAGVYVAGDVSRDVLLVCVAVAEGAKAAVAINRALLISEGLI
jgi:thioredoxin reductase